MTEGIRHPELIDLPERFEGERVMLRPYRAGDGAALFAAIDGHRDELKQWMGWVDTHQTVDDSEAYVRRMQSKWIARSALMVGIWSKDGAEFYGGTGYHGFDWDVPSLELGYFLLQDARGKGYGVDAVRVVVDLAFQYLSARRIWATCDAKNARSSHLLEKVGFEREALMRGNSVNHHGMLRDTYLYAITRGGE